MQQKNGGQLVYLNTASQSHSHVLGFFPPLSLVCVCVCVCVCLLASASDQVL